MQWSRRGISIESAAATSTNVSDSLAALSTEVTGSDHDFSNMFMKNLIQKDEEENARDQHEIFVHIWPPSTRTKGNSIACEILSWRA